MKQWFSYILLFFCISVSLANTPAFAADINAAKQKAAICAGCHGAKGISSNAQWPNLAAQTTAYIANQLKAFRSGSRQNPIMQGMAKGLSDDNIADLAAYFNSLKPGSVGGDATLAKTGKAKFSMCAGCHGAKAQGNGAFPRLAGQHPGYLITQLKNFKSGARKGGPMPTMVAQLSVADITALAAYLGSLK